MRSIFLLGGAVFLLGCVTKAPESMLAELTQPVPASWSASKQAKSGVDVNWVQRFGDSDLTAIVNEALGANYEMSIAAERLERALETSGVVLVLENLRPLPVGRRAVRTIVLRGHHWRPRFARRGLPWLKLTNKYHLPSRH